MQKTNSRDWQCIPNCGECCGIVLIPKEIVIKHSQKAKRKIIKVYHLSDLDDAVVAFTEDNKCVFLDENCSCAIYEDRPLACRQFGRIPKLTCPYIDLNGTHRTSIDTEKIKKEMNAMVMDQFITMKSLLNQKQEQA